MSPQYLRSESGPIALVEATPKRAWPRPVIAGGRLYLRDQDILLCYNVRPAP